MIIGLGYFLSCQLEKVRAAGILVRTLVMPFQRSIIAQWPGAALANEQSH